MPNSLPAKSLKLFSLLRMVANAVLPERDAPVMKKKSWLLLLALLVCLLQLCIDTNLLEYPPVIATIRFGNWFLFLFFLLAAFSCCRWLAYVVVLPFSAYLAALSYAHYAYGYTWSPDLIYALFQTNAEESSQFVNVISVLTVVLVTCFFAAVTYIFAKCLWKSRLRFFAFLFWGLLAWVMYSLPQWAFFNRTSLVLRCLPDSIRNDYVYLVTQHAPVCTAQWRVPYGYIPATYHTVQRFLNPIHLDEVEAYDSVSVFDENLTFVLVIGESMRRDHFGLYGMYPRQTTPLLAQQSGIQLFANMKTNARSTYLAIYNILAGGHDPSSAHPYRTSFLALLKKHHFHNRLFLENTYDFSVDGNMYNSIGKYFLSKQVVNGNMEKVVAAVSKHYNEPKNMIVIENKTGHFPYQNVPEYSYYKPCGFTWNRPIEPELVINDYDNCVRAVDEMLSMLIKSLESKNAVLLFVSDHGQNLGDEGRWCYAQTPFHGKDPIVDIASFVWCSPTYRAKHPEIIRYIDSIKDGELRQAQCYQMVLALCAIDVKIPGMEPCIPREVYCQDTSSGSASAQER